MAERPLTFKERMVNATARTALGLALFLPYKARLSAFGWIFAYVAAPLSG